VKEDKVLMLIKPSSSSQNPSDPKRFMFAGGKIFPLGRHGTGVVES